MAAVFDHLLVGIDDTPESLVAAVQAGVLRAPGGRLVLLAVAETHLASHAGMAAAHALEQVVAGTSADLERARELVDEDESVLVAGRLADVLAVECERRGATLAAVGVRPHRRLAALTFADHDIRALNDLSCSALVARPGWGPHRPDRVVVGVGGTPHARAAETVARSLAERLGCEVVPVVGLDEDVGPDVLRAQRDDALLHPGSLVDGIAEASSRSSLVVVAREQERGRRFRPGLAERVVYSARCSVLVLRDGGGPPGSGEEAAGER